MDAGWKGLKGDGCGEEMSRGFRGALRVEVLCLWRGLGLGMGGVVMVMGCLWG